MFAAVIAAAFAAGITSIILAVRGDSPTFVISQMWDYGTQASSELTILNSATVYYLSAVAVAIGFRMNLFNIGVDGQYRLAAMLAAAFGGAVSLPNGVRQVAIILVAMLVGAAWAGLVALLKVTRGVSEVISTIMLNFIATGLIAYLMRPSILGRRSKVANDITTTPIPKSGQVGGLDLVPELGRQGLRPDRAGGHRRRALPRHRQPHPVRLRPARHRAVGVGGRRPAASTSRR